MATMPWPAGSGLSTRSMLPAVRSCRNSGMSDRPARPSSRDCMMTPTLASRGRLAPREWWAPSAFRLRSRTSRPPCRKFTKSAKPISRPHNRPTASASTGWNSTQPTAIDQFFWHETNLRSDSYGGDLRARTRFAADIVRGIRARTSPDFPIVLRISQWKLHDYRARLAETPEQLATFLEPLVDAGVDIFHSSQRRFWEGEFGTDLRRCLKNR